MRGMMNKYLLQALLAMVLIFISTLGFSEDIELYVSDETKSAAKKTKVLLIFDTSGSMKTKRRVSASYTPSQRYRVVNAAHAYKDDTLYYKKSGEIASDHNDPRQFLAAINSCEASKTILAEEGFYSARIREYTYKGDTGSWNELRDDNSASGITMVECEEDAYVIDSKGDVVNVGSTVNASPLEAGYPVNEQGTKTNPKPHDIAQTSTNVNWRSGTFVTLYTGKYLRWYYKQNVPTVNESRMATAKKSIRSFIRSTPSIDFGLEVFNYLQGGRIVLGIPKETTDKHAALLNHITNLVASGGTPLCESLYEGSQYFAGRTVYFGNLGGSFRPPKDGSAKTEVGGKYKSPFDDCASNIAHMILITDGEPSPGHDNDADGLIRAMTTKVQKFETDGTTPVYDAAGQPVYVDKQFVGSPFRISNRNNYLAALAGWISTYDINPDISGMQTVVTHTIGFGSGAGPAKSLLIETARQGKGRFFEAENGSELTQALISIVNDLPEASDSLTSGSVAVNSLDRTQTLDSAYFAMFNSQSGPRWQGNLKKYKVVGEQITDVNDTDAICEDNGTSSICPSAQSYWSTTTDGNVVSKGGVVEWFNKTRPAQRVLYINESTSSLVTFNKTELVKIFSDETELANELGVAALVPNTGSVGKAIFDAAINTMIGWAIGYDVDAENGLVTEMRKDVFGDPLHSKPIAINYGMNHNGSNNIRIVVGTNAGALHMFKDSGNEVQESWAFMPKEFISNIKYLRQNSSSSNKIYGVDGEITLHVNDKNGNGVIEGVDTAWIFFGLRRGGSSYYGVNISDPDKPELMWHIDNTTAGFTTLGQSWSQPKIGYSQLNVSNSGSGDVASPVLFIGGGYNINKDSAGPATPDDGKGVGIYMIDALTGSLLWSALPVGGDTLFSGADGIALDSIASRIGTLDSSGDGLVDRLYTGDTGGNIWRIDMPGKVIDDFSVFKLASLGGGADDQRFFYEPAIARTYILETSRTDVTHGGSTTSVTHIQETPYDAIIIGSGDRTNPVGTDTADTLYMIKDSNIITQKFPVAATATTPAIPIPTTIVKADLHNYTDNPFGETLSEAAEQSLRLEVSKKSGWYIDLSQSGEKTSASGLVIQGSAYFTTYTPASDTSIINCKPPEGTGSLYVVDLALGIKKHDIKEGIRTGDDRAVTIGKNWLGTPTIVVVPDPNDSSQVSTSIMVDKVLIDVEQVFSTTRTYLYSTENQ
jgi:type IV pilus assembly protein PilY1